jgi:predicted Fe-Mo cluster-binding NifX family protein
MKICVTATAGDVNAQVDPRFGRCQYFVFVDSDTMAFEAMANEAIAAPGGAGIQAAQAVVNTGAFHGGCENCNWRVWHGSRSC